MAIRRFRDDPFTGLQEVVCAPGGAATLPGGAWSIAALVFCRGDSSPIVAFRTGSTRLLLQLDNATTLLTVIGGFGQTLTIPNALNQWIVIGAARPAGDPTIVRGHVYYYSTDTWVHDDLTGDGFDESSTIDNIRLGRNPDGSVSFHGDIGLITAWDVELNDAAFETLPPGLAPWVVLNPISCWPLNQTSTSDPVVDITDNGADQTALVDTTVATDNDPPFDFNIAPPEPHEVSSSIPLALSVDPESQAQRQVTVDIPLALTVAQPTVQSQYQVASAIPLTLVVGAELPSTLLPGRPLMPDATPRTLLLDADDRALMPEAEPRVIKPMVD